MQFWLAAVPQLRCSGLVRCSFGSAVPHPCSISVVRCSFGYRHALAVSQWPCEMQFWLAAMPQLCRSGPVKCSFGLPPCRSCLVECILVGYFDQMQFNSVNATKKLLRSSRFYCVSDVGIQVPHVLHFERSRKISLK